MIRLLAALRAFWRPGLSRGWPGSLVTERLGGIDLANPADAVFFEVGMQLLIGPEPDLLVFTERDFDRRKGRREAFADAWAGRP